MGGANRRRLLLGVVTVVVLATTAAAQPANYGLTSYEHFTLQYTTFEGKTVQVTEGDSYIPRYYFPWLSYLVTLWQIKIPGSRPQREVWVGAFVNPYIHEHFMGFFHPAGMPPGWRVDFLEQEFDVLFKTPPDLRDQRIAIPQVYGPTFYTADQVRRVLELYPTFLETQQITLVDTANGGSLSMAANDDGACRKRLGFESDGTPSGVKFLVRYLPEQGVYGPSFFLWLPAWQVRFGYLLKGFEEAVEWYRNEQLSRPGSFLSRRTPAASKIHPAARDCMFAVGVGASLSTVVLPNGQYDISSNYRSDVLGYFTALHGDHMQIYHLGWYPETPEAPLLAPDCCRSITPGHAALIAEASGLNRRVRSVGYTWPGVMHPGSAHYAPGLVRLDKDGSLSTFTNNAWPGVSYRHLCWYVPATTAVYTSLLAGGMLGPLGFAGAYLDSLSAAPTCYGLYQHAHPFGRNEQQVGLERLVSDLRANTPPRLGLPPLLLNETPTDCMATDGSALDVNTWDEDYYNLFRMTYSGEEWPCYGVVFGWDTVFNRPSGFEYARELANCLAGGARPVVLWPEMHGLMPTDPAADPEFAEFRALLSSYVQNFEGFWKDILFGRHYDPLDPADVLNTIIVPSVPLGGSNDPVTDRWRLPGYRPRETGAGCYPSPLRGNASAAVMAGLFEPSSKPGRRCLVLFRWTDPAMARRLQLPPSHPLYNRDEQVTLRLSAQNLKTRTGALVRLFDLDSRQWVTLGRLPSLWTEKTAPTRVDFPRYGVKVVVVD
jgi:hypothetical protein